MAWLKCLVGSLAAFTTAALCLASGFQAKVVAIQDGDTITVLRDTEQIRIRLHGGHRS